MNKFINNNAKIVAPIIYFLILTVDIIHTFPINRLLTPVPSLS